MPAHLFIDAGASIYRCTENRGPRTEDREPRTEDRGPRTENRGPRTEDREPRTKDRGPSASTRLEAQGLGGLISLRDSRRGNSRHIFIKKHAFLVGFRLYGHVHLLSSVISHRLDGSASKVTMFVFSEPKISKLAFGSVKNESGA